MYFVSWSDNLYCLCYICLIISTVRFCFPCSFFLFYPNNLPFLWLDVRYWNTVDVFGADLQWSKRRVVIIYIYIYNVCVRMYAYICKYLNIVLPKTPATLYFLIRRRQTQGLFNTSTSKQPLHNVNSSQSVPAITTDDSLIWLYNLIIILLMHLKDSSMG